MSPWSQGLAECRIYLNGTLVATNPFEGSLASLGTDNYFLGRHNYATAPDGSLDGQLDEVRLWSVMRTEEEIRANLSRRLTGSEPGLAGLWTFDDPANAGRDSSPNRFHGRVSGDAHTVEAELPKPETVPRPSLIEGSVTDPDGNPVVSARIGVFSPDFFEKGGIIERASWATFGQTDRNGRYRLAAFSPPPLVTVGAPRPPETSTASAPTLHSSQVNDTNSTSNSEGAIVVSGTVVAMDNTPLAGVPLGLAKPRASAADAPEFSGPLTRPTTMASSAFILTTRQEAYELLAMTERGPVPLRTGEMIEFDPQKPVTNLAVSSGPDEDAGAGGHSGSVMGSRIIESVVSCRKRTAHCGWGPMTGWRDSME